MEIRINLPVEIECSNCRKNITQSHEPKEELVKNEINYEKKKTEEAFFNLIKKATLNTDRFEPSFKDLYRIVGEDYMDYAMLPKPIRAVREHFKNLEFTINNTDDPRELLKISNKLVKTKAIVSKKVEKEIYKQKKRVLGLIKKRVKELRKKKKK